ncbi:hypothetical protein BIW11_05058 [Tropilaelaps mercedesae]|uniref:Uncharacterized protein n=1 Tax=Tropilaelaps mercedesae TaxID=418985 RepID=A0A1V9Y3U3_9ACAR|nr:hypothetical protein BIW11_05058 [Tropilaelaps mercedesae]
MHYFVCGA